MNNGEYITTYTGTNFYIIDPCIDDVKEIDIAHALSLTCRANGHFAHFYSIAQHSINCSKEAKVRGYSQRVQLACLLHDGSEAYISDITRPAKEHLPQYLEIEEKIQSKVYEKFGIVNLTEIELKQISDVDDVLLWYEFNALHNTLMSWEKPEKHSEFDFKFRNMQEVENEFLCMLNNKKYLNGEIINCFGAVNRITKFKRDYNLKKIIADIEKTLINSNGNNALDVMNLHDLDIDFLKASLSIKSLSSQIDVIIHTVGILKSLPVILEDGEYIESLSLGAGNTNKDFDLETNKRIAEYKFVQWSGSGDAVRENNIFKDFFELASSKVEKEKYIYCLNSDIVRRFFSKNRDLESVLDKSRLKSRFFNLYGSKYKVVSEYYNAFKDTVKIIDLRDILTEVFINESSIIEQI